MRERRRSTTHRPAHAVARPRWAPAGLVAGCLLLAAAIAVPLLPTGGRHSAGPPPILDTSASSSQPPPTAPATPEITAARVYDGPPAASPSEAVARAQAWGVEQGQFQRAAVALLDRQTGVLYTAGDVDAGYRTASLVKLFIAARMLVERQPFDPATEQLLWRMITCSDDAAATTLWARLNRGQTIDWAVQRYGLVGLSPPPAERPQSWGLTSVTARALSTFYAKVIDDKGVGPWLLEAMRQAAPAGCDEYYQHFGLPEAAASWRVKQGWIHSYNGHSYLHTTGYVDDDRYIAVLLCEGAPSLYDGRGPGSGRWIVTGMAQALLPLGHVPAATA